MLLEFIGDLNRLVAHKPSTDNVYISNFSNHLQTVREIKAALPSAKTIICLSSVSHGLPERKLLNRVYLPLLMYERIDAVILDVLDNKLMTNFRAAEALLDRDEYCMKYIEAHRGGALET